MILIILNIFKKQNALNIVLQYSYNFRWVTTIKSHNLIIVFNLNNKLLH